uniref:Uncharacterized protein n=1 Tax=Cannabis sativa TaxID=3483 RepID=A0A803Q804_CANSA
MEGFEDIMHEKGKKRGTNPDVPTIGKVVPPKRQRKTTTHKKKSLAKLIDLEVSDTETQENVPLPITSNTNAPRPEKAHASASSSKAIETLSAAVGEAGFEFAQMYGVACWRKLQTLLPPDWNLINLGSQEEMLSNSLDYNFMASFISFASNRRISERLIYMEGEVLKLLSQCKVVIKQRDEVSRESPALNKKLRSQKRKPRRPSRPKLMNLKRSSLRRRSRPHDDATRLAFVLCIEFGW